MPEDQVYVMTLSAWIFTIENVVKYGQDVMKHEMELKWLWQHEFLQLKSELNMNRKEWNIKCDLNDFDSMNFHNWKWN